VIDLSLLIVYLAVKTGKGEPFSDIVLDRSGGAEEPLKLLAASIEVNIMEVIIYDPLAHGIG